MLGERGPYFWAMLAGVLIAAHLAFQIAGVTATTYPEKYDYDEGVYAETAVSEASGARLYQQVFLSQPPLLITTVRVAFHLFGFSLAVARGVVVGFSSLWLAALFLIAAAAGRIRAGAIAVVTLVGNSFFQTQAHIVLMEVPSEALAAAAVALAVAGHRREHVFWWFLAGIAAGLAAITKFTAASVAVPLLGLVIAGGPAERGKRFGAVAIGVTLVLAPFLAMSPLHEFLNQTLSHHLHAATQMSTSLMSHARAALGFLRANWVLTALAAMGVCLASVQPDWLARIAGAWLITECLALLTITPLWYHHMILLLSPLALLTGMTVDYLCSRVSRIPRTAVILGSLFALILYLDVAFADRAESFGSFSNELRTASMAVAAHVSPTAAMITDDPMVPFLAGRAVPPEFVDSSIVRSRTHALTERCLRRGITDGRIESVLFWRGTFKSEFPGFFSETAARFSSVLSFGEGRLLFFNRRPEVRTSQPGLEQTSGASRPDRHAVRTEPGPPLTREVLSGQC